MRATGTATRVQRERLVCKFDNLFDVAAVPVTLRTLNRSCFVVGMSRFSAKTYEKPECSRVGTSRGPQRTTTVWRLNAVIVLPKMCFIDRYLDHNYDYNYYFPTRRLNRFRQKRFVVRRWRSRTPRRGETIRTYAL